MIWTNQKFPPFIFPLLLWQSGEVAWVVPELLINCYIFDLLPSWDALFFFVEVFYKNQDSTIIILIRSGQFTEYKLHSTCHTLTIHRKFYSRGQFPPGSASDFIPTCRGTPTLARNPCSVFFSCPADSSIGDLVTHSLTHWVSKWPFKKHHNRVTLEICDLWDIWSE